MPDELKYGVTADGFVIKGIDTILAEQQARARDMFGSDVDLTPGSPMRKILDAVGWQAQDLWRGLERQFYSNFIFTADGQSLDLLGADLGIERRNLRARGLITFTLGGVQLPGRKYVLPEGTIVTAGGIRFRTLEPTTLELPAAPKTVPAEAMERGPIGDIGANLVTLIDADYARAHLNIPTGTTVTPSNPAAFIGGTLFESDDDYRSRLRGFPRTVWTLDRIAATVRDIDGVRDVRVFDPLGGVDVSQSYFNLFRFTERVFSADRRFASPYFFDIVVATDPGWPWRTGAPGTVEGRYEFIVRALRDVRPVSIFPNVVPANHVEIGVRCTLKVQPGHDRDAILGDIRARIHRYVASLHLGGQVLYSDVLVRARVATGVIDVQQLHLRRCPAQFDGINFGGAQFRQTVEMAVGENIDLASDEVAFFTIDSQLIDIEVVEQ
jgi:hypothetical protein